MYTIINTQLKEKLVCEHQRRDPIFVYKQCPPCHSSVTIFLFATGLHIVNVSANVIHIHTKEIYVDTTTAPLE